MTNNIERLYELAKVPKFWNYDKEIFEYRIIFDEKRQLNIIKLLCSSEDFFLDINGEIPKFTDVFLWTISVEWYSKSKGYKNIQKDFPQSLAGLVCELWQDLTDEQKAEIKRILE